ncbi:MAG: hypothetical protein COA37_17815 [Hoeflea sp.]|uniref:capsid cement protein n=1 Tax=Hoeflea sp. TaxID=1940281 RepID=UPI000C0F6DC5|nr:capsid cement protein [Hoeflea sp.]PHR19287.1 MAG: hypothetical protein COA37_17815 [Hoeflea sp.]
MNRYLSLLNLTVVAAGAIGAYELVGFNDQAIAAEDAAVKGIALNPAAIGEPTAAMAAGTITIKADGVINAGEKIISSATKGRVKTAGVDPANAFAVALTSAADGELVEILIR